jgi:hypothetical protein
LVNGADIGMLKAIGNTIEFLYARGSTFTFNNCPASMTAQVWGNTCPEHFYAANDSRRPTAVGFGGGSAAGRVQTSPSGPFWKCKDGNVFAEETENDAARVNYSPARVPDGTNGFAAVGTWAALIRDPNPAVYA